MLARSVFFLLHTFSAGKTETIMRGTPCSQRERWRTSLRQDYCYSKMLQLTGRKCPKGTPLSRCRPESTLFFFFFFFFLAHTKYKRPSLMCSHFCLTFFLPTFLLFLSFRAKISTAGSWRGSCSLPRNNSPLYIFNHTLYFYLCGHRQIKNPSPVSFETSLDPLKTDKTSNFY